MNITAPQPALAGYIKIEKFRGNEVDGEVVEEAGSREVVADWFPNLITNAGLEAQMTQGIFGPSGVARFCAVGSGSTAPTVNDGSLEAQVGTSNTYLYTTSGATNAPPYYGYYRTVYRFAPGVAAGNLSEVGFLSAEPDGTLWSRALIKDGNGDPTTITVTPIEYLDVTYEVRLYPPLADVTGAVTISGASYDYTLRAARVTDNSWGNMMSAAVSLDGWGSVVTQAVAYNGGIGGITENPSGTSGSRSSSVVAPYESGSLLRTASATWEDLRGNLDGGIKSVLFRTTRGAFQVEFTPALPKDNTKELTLTVNIGPIGRHTP